MKPKEDDYANLPLANWGSNALSGASSGAMLGMSMGGPMGAAVGGTAGLALGLGESLKQNNDYLAAQKQQQALNAELSNTDLYDRFNLMASQQHGAQRQQDTQAAQQASARGGLSAGQGEALRQQAGHAVDSAYGQSLPGIYLAAQQADIARQKQVLDSYSMAQALADANSPNGASWTQAMGMASKAAGTYNALNNTPATLNKAGMGDNTDKTYGGLFSFGADKASMGSETALDRTSGHQADVNAANWHQGPPGQWPDNSPGNPALNYQVVDTGPQYVPLMDNTQGYDPAALTTPSITSQGQGGPVTPPRESGGFKGAKSPTPGVPGGLGTPIPTQAPLPETAPIQGATPVPVGQNKGYQYETSRRDPFTDVGLPQGSVVSPETAKTAIEAINSGNYDGLFTEDFNLKQDEINSINAAKDALPPTPNELLPAMAAQFKGKPSGEEYYFIWVDHNNIPLDKAEAAWEKAQ